MAIEYELKFETTPQVLAAIDEKIAASATTYRMETTYYDTPTGQFSARHYTLRCRKENDVSVCTLKTPAKNGRNEIELSCPRIEDALEALCQRANLPQLKELLQEGIVPVCGARFTRIAKTLAVNGGTVELALDQGVLLGGGKEIPLCEVEVELKSGSTQVAETYAKALALQFGLTPQPKSKFQRALQLAKGESYGKL